MQDSWNHRPVLAFFTGIVVGLLIGAGVAAFLMEQPGSSSQKCAHELEPALLERSLELGRDFMLNHQKPDGNFNYTYDWMTRSFSPDDNSVRQAGATWGLALIYQDRPDPDVATALTQALAFCERNSRLTADGHRYVVYPGEGRGSLGTVALVALAHIEILRAQGAYMPEQNVAKYSEHLDEYLGFILSAREADGRFHNYYDHESGEPFGDPSPYSEGESLLALVKAAKYLGRNDLRDLALATADAGYEANVVEARRRDADSDTTKGYYQWSSMSYYELTTSDWPDTSKYGDWLIELADWMIDVHRTLERTRNTAYAYEGIISAYAVSVDRGDARHADKFRCTIQTGLKKLASWQVGSPIANAYITGGPAAEDPLAVGGVQNHALESPLRIDVAQHQMHAVILALRHVYPAQADR